MPPYLSQQYDRPASGRLFESSTSSESTQAEHVGPYQPRGRMHGPRNLTQDQLSYSNLMHQYTQGLDMVLTSDLLAGERRVDILASPLGTDAQSLGALAEYLQEQCLDQGYFDWPTTQQLPGPVATFFTGEYRHKWARCTSCFTLSQPIMY